MDSSPGIKLSTFEAVGNNVNAAIELSSYQPYLFQRSMIHSDCSAIHQAVHVAITQQRIASIAWANDEGNITASEYAYLICNLCRNRDPANETSFAQEEVPFAEKSAECLPEGFTFNKVRLKLFYKSPNIVLLCRRHGVFLKCAQCRIESS